VGLAAALSSVGIEAEAGGSAFSKVMVEIALAAENGGDKLEQFASVAGMTTKEFKTMFRQDATQSMLAFIKGLERMGMEGESAIKVLTEMEITEVRMRDALLRASGAADTFATAIDTSTKAWGENTALTEEAEKRYGTLASRIEMAKNQLMEIGIQFGEIFMPYIEQALNAVRDFTTWISNMDESTKENIVTLGAVVAALGPMLLAVSAGAKAYGAFAAAMKLATAANLVETAATGGNTASQIALAVAIKGVLAAKAVLQAASGPVGIALLAVSAAVVGGIALWKTSSRRLRQPLKRMPSRPRWIACKRSEGNTLPRMHPLRRSASKRKRRCRKRITQTRYVRTSAIWKKCVKGQGNKRN